MRESTDIPRKEREELLQRLRNVDADLAANRNTLTRLMEENNELRELKQKYVALKSSLNQAKAGMNVQLISSDHSRLQCLNFVKTPRESDTELFPY